MTRRDLQLAARAKQRPWDLGKDFEQSAVIAPITRAADFGASADQRDPPDASTARSSRTPSSPTSSGRRPSSSATCRATTTSRRAT